MYDSVCTLSNQSNAYINVGCIDIVILAFGGVGEWYQRDMIIIIYKHEITYIHKSVF